MCQFLPVKILANQRRQVFGPILGVIYRFDWIFVFVESLMLLSICHARLKLIGKKQFLGNCHISNRYNWIFLLRSTFPRLFDMSLFCEPVKDGKLLGLHWVLPIDAINFSKFFSLDWGYLVPVYIFWKFILIRTAQISGFSCVIHWYKSFF